MKRPGDVLADILVCENTIVRLPPRLRVLWLVISLSLVALLAWLGLVAGRAQPERAPDLDRPVVEDMRGQATERSRAPSASQ